MKLSAFRHLWGLEHAPLEAILPRIARQGYAGVEVVPQLLPDADRDRLRGLAGDAGLAIKPIVQLFAETPQEQLAEYREALRFAARFDPVAATVQGGRDRWPLEQAVEFFRGAVAIEAELGVVAGHETHRGQPLYAPWTTAAILDAVPELRVVCDFSHWVVVCERLLEDEGEAIALAASRAVHVHTRVGYIEGPQVPDPRAPEWGAVLAAHEGWWTTVWDAQRRAGMLEVTFTPEYGPPPYMHTLPFSDVPVSDLEAICDWQAGRVRELFERWRSDMGAGDE